MLTLILVFPYSIAYALNESVNLTELWVNHEFPKIVLKVRYKVLVSHIITMIQKLKLDHKTTKVHFQHITFFFIKKKVAQCAWVQCMVLF